MVEIGTRSDRRIWLETIELGLQAAPDNLGLRFEHARALDQVGEDALAEAEYRRVLAVDPNHSRALNDLGSLRARLGDYTEAIDLVRLATKTAPEDAIAHANLGYLLLRAGDNQAAREAYETALKLDGKNVEAHRGLTIALENLGCKDEAKKHRQFGFEKAPVTTLPFRGEGDGIPVLLLVSTSSANIPLERLIDSRTFVIHKLVVEAASTLAALPAHELLINAVGDADASPAALLATRSVVIKSEAPIINHPDKIARTGRMEVAARLGQIPGVRTPVIRRFTREQLRSNTVEQNLAHANLHFPILLRSVGYHTGEHFVRLEMQAAISTALSKLPGDDLLALEFIDLKQADGTYTKYRMMMINGELYPLHAAISKDWKVHYFSASMAEEQTHRDHEAAYLKNPQSVLGVDAMRALDQIAQTLGIAYGGIDFSLDDQGRVVVFEANATMVVPRIPEEEIFAYRRPAIEAIQRATHELFLRHAQSR